MPPRPVAGVRILLVEDDLRIGQEVQDLLRGDGFEVEWRRNLQGARDALRAGPDLLILDLTLPDGDGLDLCRDLRGSGRTLPVLILSARGEPEDRVRGLAVGADDYLAKPFHGAEVVARVRALLRRAGPAPAFGRLCCGPLWADPDRRRAGRGDRVLELAPREFDLLAFFLAHPGRAWTREQILERVWETGTSAGPRAVDLAVTRLRRQIEDDPGNPRFLQTVWGVGYRLAEEGEA